jgi:alkylation response protein AidB-like acyl-CoA dehydrogenase
MGRIRSGFSVTEPEVAGSDRALFRSIAWPDGDGWF